MTAPIENQNNSGPDNTNNNGNTQNNGNQNNQNNQEPNVPPGDPNDKANWTADQWKAEAEKWKGHSRTWENRANSTEKDLKEYKEKHSTDEEKAIEKAKEEARQEERARWAGTSVETAFRAANNGRFTTSQLEALLPGLNRSAFMAGNNEVDTAKVESYISAFAPATNEQNNSNINNGNSPHNAGGAGYSNQQNNGKRGSLVEGAELYKNRPNKGHRTF